MPTPGRAKRAGASTLEMGGSGEALNSGRAQGFRAIDGIKGESTDKAHKDAIEIESLSFGVKNSGTIALSAARYR